MSPSRTRDSMSSVTELFTSVAPGCPLAPPRNQGDLVSCYPEHIMTNDAHIL